MSVLRSTFVVKSWLILLFVSTNVFADNKCNFNVKLKQVLLNEGFHRNITYGIVFNDEDDEDWVLKNCQVGLDQQLPSGVYVNADELDDLRRIHRLKALTKSKINVELPAEEAQPTSAYIMGAVNDNKVNLWLPVHARYHRSRSGGGMVRNEIVPPKLFLRCPDQRLDVCGEEVQSTASFLCNGAHKDKCSVKEISYAVMTDTLVWDIPVGDLDHYYAVAFGTSLAVMSGSLYLMRAVHEAKMHIRNRLRRLSSL